MAGSGHDGDLVVPNDMRLDGVVLASLPAFGVRPQSGRQPMGISKLLIIGDFPTLVVRALQK